MIKKLSDYVLPAGACLGFCVLVLLPGRVWGDDEIPFDNAIRPLIQKYCVECHDAELSKGDLNLDRFTTRDQAIDSMALWQRAGTRIEKKEMPPRKHETQPTDDERALLTKWIGTLQINEADCNMLASEESVAWYSGDVMSRRLNRMEYEYTLRDLLGVELSVAHLFPADGAGGEGFDNDGAALFLSAIQMEKYLAGDRAAGAYRRSGRSQGKANPGVALGNGESPGCGAASPRSLHLSRVAQAPAAGLPRRAVDDV